MASSAGVNAPVKDPMPKSRFYSNLTNVKGKKVIVTGATAGIGEAIAYRFAELDVKLVIIGRRKERLETLKADLLKVYEVNNFDTDSGSKVQVYQLDVTDRAACEKFSTDIGDCDILVNNAGLAAGAATADNADYDDVVAMLHTNVLGASHLTQLFGKKMIAQKSGHVLFTGSVAGTDTYEGGSIYCATKAAIKTYADSFRMEVANLPIRVTNIAPGLCKTEFSMVRFKGDSAKADPVYANIVPLDPFDVADNVIYAVTRPAHAQIAEIKMYCTNQGHAKFGVARVGESLGGA